MFHFQVLQFIKDSMACLVFVLFANMPKLWNDADLLCLFFSLGSLLDCLFVSFRYYYRLPLTIASVKDGFGLIGMLCFTLMLAFRVTVFDGFWQIFFYLAFIIDYVSAVTVCCVTWNIYKRRIFR